MKIFKRISIIVLIILCIASISFATYLLTATQVSYDKNGTTVTVKAALDDLYTKASNAPTKVFSQGQLVNYGGEQFYSLYDVSSIDTTMEIFAKTNLDGPNVDTLSMGANQQVNSTWDSTGCYFSSSHTEYWSSVWTEGTELNLNNVAGYGKADVLGKVDYYARKKGAIKGRLLTYDEANTLKSSYEDMIYGRGNTRQGYERYWLGSLSGRRWCMAGKWI